MSSSRVETIHQFMVDSYPTAKMLSLHKALEESTGFEKRKRLVDKMYREYTRLQRERDENDQNDQSSYGIGSLTSMFTNLFTRNSQLPKGTQDDYLKLTLKWCGMRFPYFDKMREKMHMDAQLLVGNVQAGKTMAAAAYTCISTLEDSPCIMVLLNSIGSTKQIEIKCAKFFSEHAQEINKKYSGFKPFGVTLAGKMSQSKANEYGEKELRNYEETLSVLQGNTKNLILVMNNGHQLQYLNRLMSEYPVLPFTLITDESDIVAYGTLKEERSGVNAVYEYTLLRERAQRRVEISATVWDILLGDRDLTNVGITEITTTGPYKRASDIVTETLPVKMPSTLKECGEDPNLVGYYLYLSDKPVFTSDSYNCPIDHPICVLHKTTTRTADHDKFLEIFNTHPVLSEWTVIREDNRGLLLYSKKIEESSIVISEYESERGDNCDFFFPGKAVDIQEVLQFLIDNGGANRFSHIVIKSGGCCSRSKSYVSTHGQWHLTDEYYYPGKTERNSIPSIIQGVRLHHNRPDAIPLTFTTTEQIAVDWRKGNLMQEEAVDRLLGDEDVNFTCEKLPEEIWTAAKVPKAKMAHQEKNKGYKPTTVKGYDNGLLLSDYAEEIDKVIKAKYGQSDNIGGGDIKSIIPPTSSAKISRETYDAVISTILSHFGTGVWIRRADVVKILVESLGFKEHNVQARLKDFGTLTKFHSTTDIETTPGLLLRKNTEWYLRVN